MIYYNEQERNEIAWEEYSNLSLGEDVKIKSSDGSDITVGYVSDIFGKKIEVGDLSVFPTQKQRVKDNEVGLDGYVLTDRWMSESDSPEDVKEITVLFEGSLVDPEHNMTGTLNDWGRTDAQMAAKIWMGQWAGIRGAKPKQLALAGDKLKEIMDKYPNARVSLYAHSLGSMDGQVALASLEDSYLQRIDGAYLYEGPNTYHILTDKERRQVDKIKYKIFNYIDRKDIVTIGYPEKGSEGAVGTVVNINSKDRKNIGTQHMWGGYEYDSGYLNVSESDLQDYRLARAKQAMEQLDIKKKALSERYQKMVAAGYT